MTGHPNQSLVLNQSSLVQLNGGDQDAAERVTTGETGAAEFSVNREKTLESLNRYISDIQWVLTRVAKGDLRTGLQVDYKGDFELIRDSLHTITQSMNETLLDFRAAADRLTAMADQLNGQSAQLHQASLEQNQSTEELVHEVTRVKDRLADVIQSSGLTRAQTREIIQRIQSAMEERIDIITGIADCNLQNAEETKQSSSSLAKEAETLQSQVRKFVLKEDCSK